MNKKVFITMLVFLIGTSVFAQYGKITGKVIDRETGEALVGANVLIVGTSMGAATNADGIYTILNVIPGDYSLRSSYVGYQQVTMTNIVVRTGLTAYIDDIELAPEALEAEPITVTAERPLIEKSATNAIRIITSEDFERLPNRNPNEIIALQPGVVLQNDRIHIRGGRGDEVGFMIEGASIKNITSSDGDNAMEITIIPEAMQEMIVQAGGYSAEFGGANSGIIQGSFKTGGSRFNISVMGETDNLGNYPGEKVLGTNSFGYSDYVITIGGPLFTERVRFFVTGENYFIRDYNPTFWTELPKKWSDGTAIDTVYDSGLRGGNESDFEVLSMAGGNLPGRMENRYTVNGTVLFDFKQLQIRNASAYTFRTKKSNEFPIRNMFAKERLPISDRTEMLNNTKLSYFFNPTSFLELNFSYLDRRATSYDPIFEEDILAYSDSLRAAEYGWTYRNFTTQPRDYDFSGFQFRRPGRLLTGYSKNQRTKLEGSAAFTAQIGRHEMKLGGKTENWTIRNYSMGGLGSLLNYLRVNPDDARVESELSRIIRQQATPNTYGFDDLGNVITSGNDGPKHPQFSSAYLVDKIEFNDIIINVGLRYDYINMDNWVHEADTMPEFDRDEYTLANIKKAPAYTYLLPRLGFSFPITDRTVFHMQYGKFVQSPNLNVTYRGLPYSAFVLTGGYYFTNPVAYDIKPVRSIQYEIGFTQQFTDFAAVDITAFYKDITDQIQMGSVETVPGWEISSYPIYENQDYAVTKGLEFQLRLRRVSRLMGQINYTLSSARGTNSLTQSAGGAINGPGGDPPSITVPLEYDQTHVGSMNIDYRFGKGDGGPLFERFGMNFLLTFNSGHRYTLSESPGGLGQEDAMTGGILNDGDSRQRAPLEPINSSTTPWFFNIDLRLDKTVSIVGLDVNFYVYIQNLMNRRNVINVYYATGNADDDGFLTGADGQQVVAGYGDRFADLYRWVNLDNRQHNWILNDFDLYSRPRQIRFGMKIEL